MTSAKKRQNHVLESRVLEVLGKQSLGFLDCLNTQRNLSKLTWCGQWLSCGNDSPSRWVHDRPFSFLTETPTHHSVLLPASNLLTICNMDQGQSWAFPWWRTGVHLDLDTMTGRLCRKSVLAGPQHCRENFIRRNTWTSPHPPCYTDSKSPN